MQDVKKPRVFTSTPSTSDMIDGAFITGDMWISSGVLYIWSGSSWQKQPSPVTESDLTPATTNALNAKRTARFIYDATVDSKVAGTIPFRGTALPANSIVVGGRGYVVAALTGASGTTAGISLVSGDDIVADAVVAGVPWSSATTEIAILQDGTEATDLVVTAGGIPSLVVTTHNLTAGKINLFLDYIVTD